MTHDFHRIQKESIRRGTEVKRPGIDTKNNAGKLKYTQIPRSILRWLAAGIAYGTSKYVEGSWKRVPLADWVDAYERHISAIDLDCEVFDAESGLPHIVHALTCQVYIAWLTLKRQGLIEGD